MSQSVRMITPSTTLKTEGQQMNGNNSPLEHLASALISFALGVTATVSLALYSRWLQGRALRDVDADADGRSR